MRIAIVGGGISGLATAFYLKRSLAGAEVVVLEAEKQLGGTMRTENVGGFLFESGGNGFLSNKPHTLDLVRLCGAEDLLLRSSDDARKRFIYTDRLHRLPENPLAFLSTALLSVPDKLRVLGEWFVSPKRDAGDETLQSFGYRRLGKSFTEVFLDAMTAGIYASTPDRISVNAAFPAVVRLEQEYGGLFRGMIKKRKKEAGPGGVLMSFRAGVSSFIDHLATALEVQTRTQAAVATVQRRGRGFVIDGLNFSTEADVVVLACPAHAAADMLGAVDPALARRLAAIEYSPVAVVGFGYRSLAHPLSGFGLLTTSSARQRILGVLWDSSIFPDRAPDGCKSVRVMIGGQRNPELALQSREALIETAFEGIEQTMGVTSEPDVVFVKQWRRGIPDYRVGHLANVQSIFESLAGHPGLYLNSNAYKGVSLNDCVDNSRRCAEEIIAAFS